MIRTIFGNFRSTAPRLPPSVWDAHGRTLAALAPNNFDCSFCVLRGWADGECDESGLGMEHLGRLASPQGHGLRVVASIVDVLEPVSYTHLTLPTN